jgi:hypothetical protein
MTSRSLLGLAAAFCSVMVASADIKVPDRDSAIRHAQVWSPVDVAAYDFKAGDGEIAPWTTVACDYADKKYGGTSPKFGCTLAPGEEVKVKYGQDNGEVYGGVASTRLLKALGFGADSYYPVSIDCRGCPKKLGGTPAGSNVSHFDVAAIEKHMKGKSVATNKGKEGWAWSELDLVNPSAGGAPVAQRDALKLLAVFIQHTDNKTEQQRLLCTGKSTPTDPEPCDKSFMMVHDVGQTWGKANTFNHGTISSVNWQNWSTVPVWKDERQCIGHLSKSFTGSLGDPRISEAGRKFLADLLIQLTDAQLHDLFTVAHFAQGPLRMHGPAGKDTVEAWVEVFKKRRDEIVRVHCPS